MSELFIKELAIDWAEVPPDSYLRGIPALRLKRGPHRPQGSYFLRTESFYNVASQAEVYRKSGLGTDPPEWYYRRFGGKDFHSLSHGESFLALVQGEFIGGGLYLLDEPEAALSPQRQLTLLIELNRLARDGAQFIIASHSPVLLALPGAELLSFDEGVLHPCDYTQTESYRITSLFINRREWFLKQLLEEDPHVF